MNLNMWNSTIIVVLCDDLSNDRNVTVVHLKGIEVPVFWVPRVVVRKQGRLSFSAGGRTTNGRVAYKRMMRFAKDRREWDAHCLFLQEDLKRSLFITKTAILLNKL